MNSHILAKLHNVEPGPVGFPSGEPLDDHLLRYVALP